MKKDIQNLLLLTVLFASLLFLSAPISQAKCGQGCCSGNEGVCGYHCCNGKPLSEICAPCYQSAIDAQIKKEINATKAEYKNHHEGRREKIIWDIKNGYGENVDIDRIGFFVYTMLPDIK